MMRNCKNNLILFSIIVEMATMGLGMGMSPLLIQTLLAQNSHMQMQWPMPPMQQQFKGAPGLWMHPNQKVFLTELM